MSRSHFRLNSLKLPRYFPLVGAQGCVCVGGGVHGTPHKESTFPADFHDECYTIYSYTKNNFIQEKKNDLTFQNGGQITDFCFASFLISAKNHFSKGIFNEI